MKWISEYEHKPPAVRKVLDMLMRATNKDSPEIDWKKDVRPALEKWNEMYERVKDSGCSEEEAAERYLYRIECDSPEVLENAVREAPCSKGDSHDSNGI